VAIGQYLGVGGMTLIAELAPIMKGPFCLIVSNKNNLSYFTDIYKCFYLISGVGYATMVAAV
jgi:hypothetical protein